MSDLSSQVKEKMNFNENAGDKAPTLSDDLRVQKTLDHRKKISGLGSIRMSAPAKVIVGDKTEDQALGLVRENHDASDQGAMKLGVSAFLIGSIVWIAYGIGFSLQQGIEMTPEVISGLFLTLFAPPALCWYVLSQFMTSKGASNGGRSFGGEFDGDVEAFYLQAQEISSTCRAVLKSLQRARQGLRVEMRDFSGVSKKAEFHIDRLAEALKQKNESLVALVDDIDGKVNVLDEKVQGSSDAWSGALDAMLERSEKAEKRFDAGVDNIVKATDRAAEKASCVKDDLAEAFEDLTSIVDDMYSRVDGVTDRFEGHSHSLNEVVEHVAQETERLTETVKMQINDLEGAAGRTFASIVESSATITASKEKMEIGVKDLYEQSERVGAVVKQSVSFIRDSVDYVATNSSDLEDRLGTHAQSLKDSVDNISKQAAQIEEAGDQASNKLAESLSVAVGGAESVNFAIRRAVDLLEDGSAKAQNHADRIISEVGERLDRVSEQADENITRLDDVSTQLHNSSTMFYETACKATEQITNIAEAVDGQNVRLEKGLGELSTIVGAIGGTLNQSLREVQNAVNDADSRHSMIESVITRRISDLNDASDNAVKVVEDIRSNMRAQVQDVSVITAQLSGQSKTFGDQLTVQREQLESAVKSSMQGLNDVSDQLSSKVDDVRFACENSGDVLNSLSSDIVKNYKEIKEFGTQAENTIETLDQTLMTKLSAMYEQNDQIKVSFENLTDEVDSSTRSMIPACAEAMDKANQVHERFVNLRQDCMNLSESNVVRFKKFGVMIEDNIHELKQGSEQAADIMMSANDVLEERSKSLRETSQKAVLDIEKASDNLRTQSETIHLLSDKAVVNMDTVQKEINSHFMDFSESVAEAVGQLDRAGDQFMHQSDNIRDEVENNITLIETAGIKAREEVFMLTDASQKFAKDTDDVIRGVKTNADDVLGGVNLVLSDYKKAGDTLMIRSRELHDQMKASLQTSEMYGREIKGQTSAIAGSSIEVAEQIGKAISVLNSSMDQIGCTAHDTTDAISIERERLSVEADRLMQVSSAALETTKDAVDTFTRQSEAMFKSVRDVQDSIQSLQKQEVKSERSAFLSSSRFIIESLHSISVDMTRILEGGDISDRAWQSFLKGDVSIFTKKLVALGEDWPIEKAQDKFKTDAEFRTYVQRYVRQFEEVYDQASSSDHGGLLGITIGSSDIAKLYDQLCKVAMRQSKLSVPFADKKIL